MLHLVTFRAHGVVFAGYSYPGASVGWGGLVPWALVRDADPSATPPELRLHTGETLAIPAVFEVQLRAALAKAGVPIVDRVDVWALLLEPFLDTEFGEAEQRRTIEQLAQFGIAEAETEQIRKRVGDVMLRYNSVHWEWAHLGLFDLLDAHLPAWPLRWWPPSRRAFEQFYRWAMEVAERARAAQDMIRP